ncbi:MAG: HAD family hydrolase [Anaerolineae bacterium]
MGITAVIFDIGGVIANQDQDQADRDLARLWPRLSSAAVTAARNEPGMLELWHRHSCGRADADLYWGAVLAQLGIEPAPAAVAAMRDIQRRTLWSSIDRPVLEMACRVHEEGRFRTGVLSNSAVDYEPHIGRFDSCFHRLHFSHRTGLRKPDPTAYIAVVRDLGSELGETLFIDDKARNTEAAASLGMPTVQFTDAGSLAVEMAELGVAVPESSGQSH